MKIIFLIAVLVCLSFGYTSNRFVADYTVTSAGINGVLKGVIYYSEADRAVRMDQADGYKDLAIFSTDANSLFRYFDCSGSCEIEPIASDDVFPKYYKVASDSCGAPGPLCTVCTRNDGSQVQSVCVDGSNNIVSTTLKNGRTITFNNFRDGIVSSTFTPFTGCQLNCYAELDIVLVVDDSGSISGNYIPDLGVNSGEWKQIREFAIDFTKNFEIGATQVHMGLVQFSKGSRKVISSPHIVSNSDQFNLIVDGLTKTLCTNDPREWNTATSCRGATWTGHGLIDAISILENTAGTRALRANAGKIAVIITDGNSFYSGASSFQYNGQTFAVNSGWITYVKNSGVTVIAVGVGDGIDEAELNSYASKDVNGNPLVFMAATFDYLASAELIEKLGRTVCTANGVPETCGGTCRGSCQCGSCGCPSSCDRGNMCEVGVCSATTNTAGGCFYTAKKCDDENACTIDSCNPATGCTHTPLVCDDGNPCTIDTCNAVSGCIYTPKVCSTGDFCQISTCSELDGECLPPVPNPICEDENECTFSNSSSGSVVFQPIDCSGDDLCKIYDCNATTGCTEEDRNCDDNNVCTIDSCLGGDCQYAAVVCDDDDMCTVDTCDREDGCIHTDLNVSVACDDGNVCTVDTCDSDLGCVNTDIVCQTTSDDACIVATCDPINGCIEIPKTCELSADADPDCVLSLCVEGSCVESETETCRNSALLTAAIAAGTLITVLIIIGAIIVGTGVIGGATYAAFQIANADEFKKSGIFEAQTQHHQNPIHGRETYQ